MKTIREWIQELPDGYRELAMKYEKDSWSVREPRMSLAILSDSFQVRGEGTESTEFRYEVHNHYSI